MLQFIKEKKRINRNILVRIFNYYLENNSYNKLLDGKIKQWIDGEDSFLWEVIYRLYNIKPEYTFNKKIEEKIFEYMKSDMAQRCSERKYLKYNNKIDFYPAYYNKEIGKLFLKTLNKVYKECATNEKKESFFDYFLWMLSKDYQMEGAPDYKLLFVEILEEKDIRNRVRNMYLGAWRKWRVRNLWVQILEKHFLEREDIQEDNWEYMKEFWQMLAFTGEKSDFDMVQNELRKIEYATKINAGNKLALELNKIVENRRR